MFFHVNNKLSIIHFSAFPQETHIPFLNSWQVDYMIEAPSTVSVIFLRSYMALQKRYK